MPTAEFPHTHHAASEFLSRRAFDRSVQWDSDLPLDLVERIWRTPHALLASSEKLQEKLRCTVARIEHPVGMFTWKHHNWGTLRRTVKKSLAQSPAKKSWLDSHYLEAAGIPTPRTRAYLEKRIGPFQRCSYLLIDYIAGTSLYRLMRFESPSADLVEHLAAQVAAIWQQLDDLGVWHNDFKTENFVVDRNGKVWLIDFERLRRFRAGERDHLRERQIKDARDFLHPRNWRSEPAAAEVFRRAIAATPAAQQTLAGPRGAEHPLGRPLGAVNRSEQLVTVLISSRNAADTIVGCLESVRDMADEILVADAGSTDGTLELVRKFGGCRVIESTCTDPVVFETWAHDNAKHDWILRLRPDERLNGELSRQVQDLLATEPPEDGFRIAQTVYFRGKRLRFGAFDNEPSIRLYRKQAARYEVCSGRIEVSIPSQRIGNVKSRLVYESCSTIIQCLTEIKRAAIQAAQESSQQGRHAQRRSVLWRTARQFAESYLLHRGILDGWAGLHASCLTAAGVYLRETMLLEIEQPTARRRSLVHDRWRELKVFTPEEILPAAQTGAGPIRSAA
ncbi:MAG: lipopolysaccharide kinase InaA family protein [Pirellulales bacterium]